jgi:hypothetical protein
MEGEMIRNLIVSCEGKRLRIQETQARVSVKRLISWLVKELDLPEENEQGYKIKYVIILRRTGSTLRDSDTLVASDIQEQDELELKKEIQIMNEPFPPDDNMPISPETKKGELQERDALRVIERLGDKVVDAFNESSERKDKLTNVVIGIDKNILLVFSIAFLGSLFFSFYLIAVDKTTSVTNFLYPIISLVIGFMSGYFAGSGRTQGKK